LAADTAISLAPDTVLDLSGMEQNVALLSGSGSVSNGTLVLTGTIYPGGSNTVGTLTLNSVRFENAQLMTDLLEGAADQLIVTATGATDLSGLTVIPLLPANLKPAGVYCIAETAGTFANLPALNDTKWTCARSGNNKQLLLAAKNGTILVLR